MYKVGPLHTTVIFFVHNYLGTTRGTENYYFFQQMVDLQATELWDVLHRSL